MTCTGVAQSGYMRRSECAAQRDVAMTAVARRNTAPSSCTFGRYDARSIADVASCSTHSCVQSIDTTDGIRRIRSRLAYAVACRWKWMTSNGSGPAACDPAAGEQARVQLVPEARQVEVPEAERAVDPHALAERAADGAIEQRQILGEDDVPPLDGGLVWEIFPEEVVEGGEPQDAAVDEQHADHWLIRPIQCQGLRSLLKFVEVLEVRHVRLDHFEH